MSDYVQKPNCGSLFVNKNKKTEASPAYTGTSNLDGVLYRVSAWVTTSANGLKYMSLRYTKVSDMPGGVATVLGEEDELPFNEGIA